MTDSKKQRVVVLGASTNPERYSHMAIQSLLEHNHEVLPVNPSATSIAGLNVFKSPDEINGRVDTITMYVSEKISAGLEDAIAALGPTRVIFNPGSENPTLQAALEARGIRVQEACTLVLLTTNQF